MGQPHHDPTRLVFIDETGLSATMARLRGGAPYGHWKTISFTGVRGMSAPSVHDGAINATVFPACVKAALVPTLKHRNAAIMGTLPAHRSDAVGDAIGQGGATLLIRPPDSPHRNPIERAFARRKAAKRIADGSGQPLTTAPEGARHRNAPTPFRSRRANW